MPIIISTHAPLAGRDMLVSAWIAGSTDFNPRAPCGARHAGKLIDVLRFVFQPTRPLRGATADDALARLRAMNISTHAPLAGRDRLRQDLLPPAVRISTHAPLAGRDGEGARVALEPFRISTHAPLAGRDLLR